MDNSSMTREWMVIVRYKTGSDKEVKAVRETVWIEWPLGLLGRRKVIICCEGKFILKHNLNSDILIEDVWHFVSNSYEILA